MKKNNRVTQLAVIGVMAAVICIIAPFTIPIGAVPLSLANLAIFIAIYALGTKKGVISYCIYLLIGFVGMPVFSGFTSGPGKLFGPTGGYLIGFIPMAVIAGICIDKFFEKRIISVLGMIAGTAVCNVIGTLWLAYQAQLSLPAAWMAGVVPFIPGDLLKIVIAAIIGPKLRRQLHLAGLFEK